MTAATLLPGDVLPAQPLPSDPGVRRSPKSLEERYAAVHRVGYDCRVTCARNLLEFHGHLFSNAVLFGLSSIFFFVYRKIDDRRCRLLFPEGNFVHRFWPISGQKLEALDNIAYLTGAHLVRGGDPYLDAAASREEIRPYLDDGLPVMVTLCRDKLFELRGLPREGSWFPADLGFGGHWVVVTEIDDARGVVRLFETDQPMPLEVSFEAFHVLRTHGDRQANFYMQSRNRWAVLLPPRHLRPFADLADAAIRKTVHELRHPLIEDGTGMSAFDAFCAELPDWAERGDLPPQKLYLTVAMAYLSSEYMIGGGMGRRGYGLFLRRAGRALGSSSLVAAARHYRRAGDLWQRLMLVLSREVLATDGPWNLRHEDLVDTLARLHAAETAGFEHLCEYVEAASCK